MLEGRSAFAKNNNSDKEKVLQRSNRVFILQYSPERSKSKKHKKWETIEPKKDMLSSYLTRREMLSQNEPAEQTSNRRGIDRLATLISRNKSASEEGESGCERLVKAVNKILRYRVVLSEAMEALKKYTMLCSSTNYELFIQSKHQNLFKDKKGNQLTLSPIQQYRPIEEKNLSKQSSLLSPKYSPIEGEMTFRKPKNEINSPLLRQSILNGIESPRKQLEQFKVGSKDYIPTAETLRSYGELQNSPSRPLIVSSKPISIIFRTNPVIRCVLNQLPLIDSPWNQQKVQSSPLFLYPDNFVTISTDQIEENQFENILIGIPSQHKIAQRHTQASNYIKSSRTKLNFALPTPILTHQQPTITSQPFKASLKCAQVKDDKSKRDRKHNQKVLNANQIAQRMLFGMQSNEPASIPSRFERVESGKIKKRVSSLPKITFTYTSRQKYMRLQHVSPSSKCIPTSIKDKAPLRAVINAQPQRKVAKQQLHSTFGSTQPPNPTHLRNSRLQSPQHSENQAAVMRIHREPINSKVFTNKLLPGRIESEYYSGANQPLITQQPFRQRIVTTQPFSNHQIEYVGIEQQPRGCCWVKQTRSRSLNDRVLVSGLQRPLPF